MHILAYTASHKNIQADVASSNVDSGCQQSAHDYKSPRVAVTDGSDRQYMTGIEIAFHYLIADGSTDDRIYGLKIAVIKILDRNYKIS